MFSDKLDKNLSCLLSEFRGELERQSPWQQRMNKRPRRRQWRVSGRTRCT